MEEKPYGYKKFENVRGKWYSPMILFRGKFHILFGKKYSTATTALRMAAYFWGKTSKLEVR